MIDSSALHDEDKYEVKEPSGFDTAGDRLHSTNPLLTGCSQPVVGIMATIYAAEGKLPFYLGGICRRT